MSLRSSGTGADQFAKGQTSQRPGSPSKGDMRFNTNTTYMEYWDGSSWNRIAKPANINNGAVNVSVGAGIKQSGSNTSANQPNDKTKTLSFDQDWGDRQGWNSTTGPGAIQANCIWTTNTSGNVASIIDRNNVASITMTSKGNYRITFSRGVVPDYSVSMGWADGLKPGGRNLNNLDVATTGSDGTSGSLVQKNASGVVLCWGGRNASNLACQYLSMMCTGVT